MKMSKEAREALNRYMREYRKRPDVRKKEKERRAKYWERKAAEYKKAQEQNERTEITEEKKNECD